MKSLREQVAELEAASEIQRRGLVPKQNPSGTEGYKCDLSGWWILTTPHGETAGMNYATPEEAIAGMATDYARWNNYTGDANAILAVIRRRFVEWDEKKRFNLKLSSIIAGETCSPDNLNDSGIFCLATATPEQLCRATIAAAGKEQP